MSTRGNTLHIVTVGTTEPPLAKAVQDAQVPGTLVLFYGRSLDQRQAPIEIAARLRDLGRQRGLAVREFEVSDPEDFLRACAEMEEAIGPLLGQPWECVRLNITGGTKVLSAALCELAPLFWGRCEVVVEYTGGQQRDATGRVAGEMRTTTLPLWTNQARHALRLFSLGHYHSAFAWAQALPAQGRPGLVREGLEALARWDDMDYARAWEGLKRFSRQTRHMGDDQVLEGLGRVVTRLLEASERLVPALRKLDSQDKLERLDVSRPQVDVLEALGLLAADALENGQRRFLEGRYTDAALRSYRAVEVASQRALLAHGVNPWSRLNGGPIALDRGLQLLRDQVRLSLPWDEVHALVQAVQQPRNYSLLEHGYSPVQPDTASSVLSKAERVVALLWSDVALARPRLSFDMAR